MIKPISEEELNIADEIQKKLRLVLLPYIDEKRPIIASLEWIKKVIENDLENGLNVYENSYQN